MSLTGNIEVFPLQEVLRLLARSSKNGCLRVESGSVHGRIYLDHGALTLATVASDREIIEQLDAAGLVEATEHRMDTSEMHLPDHIADGRDQSDLTDFVREHVVESLYRMRKPGTGSFEFLVDATSRFGTGQSFDAEVAVAEADRRASEWADIEETIADMDSPLRMVRELAQPEVTVNSATWRVLASLDGGASVTRISQALGMTLFRSAREVGSLVRAGLLETVPEEDIRAAAQATAWGMPEADEVPEAIDEPVDEAPWGESESVPAEAPAPWESSDSEEVPSEWQSPGWGDAPAEETVDDSDVDDMDDFFSSFPAAAAPADEVEAEPAPEAETPSADKVDQGWWADAMGADEPDTGDDADAFLESVFSQLDGPEESAEEAEEETGFSMGLLRRRRMGPLSKDITEGS